MKKLIFLFLMVGFSSLGTAQYQNNINASIFTGAYLSQKNTNNRGYWYGLYFEYLPIKTPSYFSFGVCFLTTYSHFKSNDWWSWYQGNSQQVGFGLVAGKYWEFFSTSQAAYLGGNVMIRDNQDRGKSKNYSGEYRMIQDDLFLSWEINFNLLKEFGFYENLFPRTQIRFGGQTVIKSDKEDYWNDEKIPESILWNKASLFVDYKQSWLELGSFDQRYQFKSVLGYQFYQGDKTRWFIIGPEFSLKKRGQDDYLAIFFLFKKQVGQFEDHLNSRQFIFGLNFQPFNLKN